MKLVYALITLGAAFTLSSGQSSSLTSVGVKVRASGAISLEILKFEIPLTGQTSSSWHLENMERVQWLYFRPLLLDEQNRSGIPCRLLRLPT